MNSILQATADLLKSKKFHPASTEDGETLVVRCTGDHAFWVTDIDTSEDGSVITLLTRVPAKVPPAKRTACARLVAQINYGKRKGAFHLDLRDGEIVFCISNTLNAGIISEEIIDSLFGTTWRVINEYTPEFLKLIYGRAVGADPDSKARARNRARSATPPGLNN